MRALSAAAQARNMPVNLQDRPDLSSFIMPSVIDRAPLTIAVSTGGASPVLARLVRQKIEALIPPGWGRLAALAARLQAETRAALPDLARRRQVLERILSGTPPTWPWPATTPAPRRPGAPNCRHPAHRPALSTWSAPAPALLTWPPCARCASSARPT